MATAEPSPSSLGPRYAPDDPTLPQPWKGLIDGSTGLLYYWNPETNVTQYEKPEAAPAPVAPAAAATPKLNPIPAARASELESIQSQQNQQMMQNQLPQGQVMSSSFQQQTQPTLQAAQQQVIPPGQMQGPQYAHAMQQGHVAPDQARQQSVQHNAQQVPPQFAQIPMHPGQQGPPQASQQVHTQPGAQAPYQQMQPMTHNAQGQMRPPHGYQFTPQQTQYTMHQPNMPPQGPYNSSQQPHHLLQRPQLPQQQDHKVGYSQREDIDFHHGKQAGFSPAQQPLMQGQKFQHPSEQKPGVSHRDDVVFQHGKQAGYSSVQIQQSATSPLQSMPVGNNSTIAVMNTQPGQSTLYGGSSAYMQHNKPAAADFANLQHGPKFQNQMGPGMMHGPQKNLPPLGSRTPYEENHAGRAGEEYFYNSNKDINAIHQMPKLAPLPGTRNQQEMRIGNLLPAQTGPHHLPGGFNGPGGPPFHGAHGIASGPPPFQNNAFVRPPMPLMGSSDPHNLSAEVYRQKHEVTATGDDVPPPFMTFEASGLPPELLREVRYLLRRRSTCRTLPCYAHI